MSEDAFDTEEARRLITILSDEDLFRRVIRGWAIVEDAFEDEIAGMLVEPVPLPPVFRHKLTLAIGLGIVPPERRKPFEKLAAIRNDLAHDNRDPQDIAPAEFEGIVHGFAPGFGWEPIPPMSEEAWWSELALSYAWSAVRGGGRIARVTREQERDALRRELDLQLGEKSMSSLIHAIARKTAADAGEERDEPPPE